MAIQLRQCEPVHVPVLLRALRSWQSGSSMAVEDEGASRSLLGLTRNPSLGSVWLIEHRGELAGYAVVEMLPARGFLWQEATLSALYLVPEARLDGVGRVVRRVLGGLLLGRGCGLGVEERPRDDRHWPLLMNRGVPQSMLSSAAA